MSMSKMHREKGSNPSLTADLCKQKQRVKGGSTSGLCVSKSSFYQEILFAIGYYFVNILVPMAIVSPNESSKGSQGLSMPPLFYENVFKRTVIWQTVCLLFISTLELWYSSVVYNYFSSI